MSIFCKDLRCIEKIVKSCIIGLPFNLSCEKKQYCKKCQSVHYLFGRTDSFSLKYSFHSFLDNIEVSTSTLSIDFFLPQCIFSSNLTIVLYIKLHTKITKFYWISIICCFGLFRSCSAPKMVGNCDISPRYTLYHPNHHIFPS